MRYTTSSERETFSLAKKIAKTLKGGEVMGLIGQLGAGKTVFVKGLAAGLGIKKHITSPTFVLMKVYPVKLPGIKYLVHIDAYRLKSAEDLIAIGAPEYFNQPDTITVIEWADKIKKILPRKARLVNIKIINNTRIIF